MLHVIYAHLLNILYTATNDVCPEKIEKGGSLDPLSTPSPFQSFNDLGQHGQLHYEHDCVFIVISTH